MVKVTTDAYAWEIIIYHTIAAKGIIMAGCINYGKGHYHGRLH